MCLWIVLASDVKIHLDECHSISSVRHDRIRQTMSLSEAIDVLDRSPVLGHLNLRISYQFVTRRCPCGHSGVAGTRIHSVTASEIDLVVVRHIVCFELEMLAAQTSAAMPGVDR